ncbi:uncharacterized protein LOC124595164 isoform X1 [Schistocerca americana]|uniref:uncharacterized protein LOC124595006 n=1 Tax=Schistocerca americana TaxID=7009 RepID=UPI001F4FE375|nr:uncharacterized protein LOC124595006 [Schistocerca americana]XP_046989731.1 uncharacterized protein LOC124595164 isoform X1 [Schistocerca americana]XP_047108731.1 uncharacterized protein LOC124777385 [Schistocerca piceifrons]XP_047108973.1 uncharacterized protein LOC124777562 [Schistocerca piceifrons]
MKAALLLVAALVAVAEVHGQPEESTTVTISSDNLTTSNITAERTFLAKSSYTGDDDTICVESDNKFYLYVNVLKLYSCYNQLRKVYVVKPRSQCEPHLSDCPRH